MYIALEIEHCMTLFKSETNNRRDLIWHMSLGNPGTDCTRVVMLVSNLV